MTVSDGRLWPRLVVMWCKCGANVVQIAGHKPSASPSGNLGEHPIPVGLDSATEATWMIPGLPKTPLEVLAKLDAMASRELVIRLDENLIEAVARTAADDHVSADSVVEDALRRYFGIRGLAVLADLADASGDGGPLSEEEAMATALAEIRSRAGRRSAAG